MVETTETTAEQLYEYDKVEYLFGSMLLDPRVQHYFGADDRIASNPDTNPITITTQYILYAFEENEPTLENIRQLRDETRAALADWKEYVPAVPADQILAALA